MEILPFVSVGDLAFGNIKRTVRRKLGSDYTTFRKDKEEPLTDSYDDLGLHLYYDKDGHLDFVESFEPNALTFRGISFVDQPLRSMIKRMSDLGFDHIKTDAGFIFPDAGVVLTTDGKTVESVAAYRKGYYD